MSSPRDDKDRTQIPWLLSLCFALIVLLSTHPRVPSVEQSVGEGRGYKWAKTATWRLHWRSSGISLWHFPLFWPRKMKAAATTNRWDQELELGTACCGNSLFILGLSFLTSPFRPVLTLSPPHPVSIPLLQLHSALYCWMCPSNRQLLGTRPPPDPASSS